MKNVVATLRRSSLVSTFGVGSLLAAGEDSVMICGIDSWTPGEIIGEPRLAASLGVREFRSPRTQGGSRGDVPAVRFPEWVFCPGCRRLGPHWQIADDTSRRCLNCNDTVSPSRFVSCCLAGHIEDFPYRAWVHQDVDSSSGGHDLKLVAQGHTSALSDLEVRCSCGRRRSMDGAFGSSALRGVRRCSGQRPWLVDAGPEQCAQPLRTLQRGSSNVWFSVTRSAISIPSVADRAAEFIERRLRDLNPDLSPEALAPTLRPPEGCTVEDVRRAIERARTPSVSPERPSDRELHAQEYEALKNGNPDTHGRDHFQCVRLDLEGSGLPDLVAQLSRVGRLREVRALTSFSRVIPATPGGEFPPVLLSPEPLPWLPAVEVLGEGIFLRLNEEVLVEWTEGRFARNRVRMLLESQDSSGPSGFSDELAVSARSLVLHSLAHILIDELALTAGYPAASLRERIYDEDGQAGILLYTASADSAGSLGGLAAQSDPKRFESVLANAVARAQWCTTDPVCIESSASGVNGMNLAACHACLLVPETSCEQFNLGLDRATLVGLPEDTDAGLLSSWVLSRSA